MGDDMVTLLSTDDNITDQRLLGLAGQRSEPQPPRLWGTRLLHFPIIESMGESLQFVTRITNIAITMANCAKCNHTFMVHS